MRPGSSIPQMTSPLSTASTMAATSTISKCWGRPEKGRMTNVSPTLRPMRVATSAPMATGSGAASSPAGTPSSGGGNVPSTTVTKSSSVGLVKIRTWVASGGGVG